MRPEFIARASVVCKCESECRYVATPATLPLAQDAYNVAFSSESPSTSSFQHTPKSLAMIRRILPLWSRARSSRLTHTSLSPAWTGHVATSIRRAPREHDSIRHVHQESKALIPAHDFKDHAIKEQPPWKPVFPTGSLSVASTDAGGSNRTSQTTDEEDEGLPPEEVKFLNELLLLACFVISAGFLLLCSFVPLTFPGRDIDESNIMGEANPITGTRRWVSYPFSTNQAISKQGWHRYRPAEKVLDLAVDDWRMRRIRRVLEQFAFASGLEKETWKVLVVDEDST